MKKTLTRQPSHPHRTMFSTTRHVFRYITEYIRVLSYFKKTPACVTVYGSARIQEDHPFYQQAVDLGKALAENQLAVMTGGGPGLMEAVNKGAYNAGGLSLGCAIELPREQDRNPYLNRSFTCRYFFIRKIILSRYSKAFIALPGGYGTLDELFEMLNLICTERVHQYTVVLLGVSYWQPFFQLIQEHMVAHEMINDNEAHFVHMTDDIDTAIELINDAY